MILLPWALALLVPSPLVGSSLEWSSLSLSSEDLGVPLGLAGSSLEGSSLEGPLGFPFGFPFLPEGGGL